MTDLPADHKEVSGLLEHPKRSTTTDAAVGLCVSETNELGHGHVRRAHYYFLQASCSVWHVVAWRLVALCGLLTEGSCELNWP
jgi:hypothetical protein